MKVLMFGWEFPPHISGGLGTACFGLTQALAHERTDIIFVVPKADDHQPFERVSVISASHVPVTLDDIDDVDSSFQGLEKKLKAGQLLRVTVGSTLSPYFSPDFRSQESQLEQWNYEVPESRQHETMLQKERKTLYPFSGGYGPRLFLEVDRYADVAKEIARQHSFDVIHAHDWLTYRAGIEAKRISRKPLVIHVHATEFDRSGEDIDPRVFQIEQEGMQQADHIIAVSRLTKRIIQYRYGISESKITVVYNGVLPKRKVNGRLSFLNGKKVVTFLGRVTHQKGPGYFVEAASKVLQKFPDTHFLMAGSGDLLPKMVRRVAEKRMSSNFHFTGFLNASKVDHVWSISNVYVMPSVSEPFGITPLEAMMAGVPVIISKQSGVAEVVRHAIKVDFWDAEALADAICNLIARQSLSNTIARGSRSEVKNINWERAAKRINTIYHEIKAQY